MRRRWPATPSRPSAASSALNRTLDAEAARRIVEIFTEVIIAPDATDEAKAIVAAKKNLRLLLAGGLPDPKAPGIMVKTVAGGLLVQSRDNAVVDTMDLKVVTKRAPTAQELTDLRFAFRVAKHVKSNTIVYAKDGATVGVGAGQMSRVDSARIAARKAQDAAEAGGWAVPLTKGSVVASDAFFPFADGLLAAVGGGRHRGDPARRLDARQRGHRRRRTTRASPWSSPGCATSGTEEVQLELPSMTDRMRSKDRIMRRHSLSTSSIEGRAL